ncbi:unnamed protein product, partial [Protopolystoma xenopodis]
AECKTPEFNAVSYTTREALLSSKTVFVISGEVKCDGAKLTHLYAVLNDEIQPISNNIEDDRFQVTFAGQHKKFRSGTYMIRFFTEEDIYLLRRAKKSGSAETIKPIYEHELIHKGLWYSPWVHSETVAL